MNLHIIITQHVIKKYGRQILIGIIKNFNLQTYKLEES